jgi:hypothetical protein
LFSNPTLRNFEPRIGIVWDPFKDGKTVVRTGAGVFDVLPLPYQFIFLQYRADGFLPRAAARRVGLVSPIDR